MKKLYSIDYNKLTANQTDQWKFSSRNNAYVFQTSDGIKTIEEFVEEHRIQSMIDYGCGHGHATDNLKITTIVKFDPFIEEFSNYPSDKVDLIVSNNVLQHIEVKFFDEVMQDFYNLTNKFIICNIILSKFTHHWFIDKFLKHNFQIEDMNVHQDSKTLFLLASKKRVR